MEDYINKLKHMILIAREDMKSATARMCAFEEALEEYETLLVKKENEKKEG